MGESETQTPRRRPVAHPGPAVAMIDIGAVPPGLAALDALVKEAEVDVLSAGTVQPGRYLILFAGGVEPVRRSLERAQQTAAGALVDSVLLADAEPRILPALVGAVIRWPADPATQGDTVGVVQTGTSPTLLAGVDAGLKGALVELVELRVADGLGGHGLATFWGETHDVEAAMELAERAIARGRSEHVWTTVIRNADPEVARSMGRPSRFYGEWRG